ncbi:hypothetical protein Gpo141_00011432 [Globisporangium polare]
MTIGVPTAAAAVPQQHRLSHSHLAPAVKAERSPGDDRQQPHPAHDEDDERRRATTAMAIVELLATGGGNGNGTAARGPTLPPPPAPLSNSIWLGNSYHNSASTMNNTATNSNNSRTINNNGSDGTPMFPGLAALLPMKRPLWKVSGTGADPFKTNHVHIQPLPSIAQLSKLAVSDRSSPTRIDAVAANNSAASASASPTMTPTATPPPASTPVTSSTAAVSVNHSRKRQKDELDKLRVQVQELQRELDHVRGRLPKRPQQYAVNGTTGLPDMHASLPSSVTIWERIASHQKEQKNKSEMENMKLKSMVQEQVKISKALEKLVNKRCKNSSLESKFAGKRLRVCDSDEQLIFDALTRDIDERYKQVDAEFEKLGMNYEKREQQEAHMILDTVNGPTMELKDATIFPFDVQALNDAVWRSMEVESFSCKETMGMIESLLVHASEDTMCMKTTVPIQAQRSPESDLSIRAVIKRFVERNRVVILWESVTDCLSKLPQCSSSSLSSSSSSGSTISYKDVEMRDRGWCMIESLPSPPGRHSSIIQLCSHIAPRVTGESMPLQHMHGLVDSVAPCYRYIWGNRQQIMENILMENVVGLPRPSMGPWPVDAPETS